MAYKLHNIETPLKLLNTINAVDEKAGTGGGGGTAAPSFDYENQPYKSVEQLIADTRFRRNYRREFYRSPSEVLSIAGDYPNATGFMTGGFEWFSTGYNEPQDGVYRLEPINTLAKTGLKISCVQMPSVYVPPDEVEVGQVIVDNGETGINFMDSQMATFGPIDALEGMSGYFVNGYSAPSFLNSPTDAQYEIGYTQNGTPGTASLTLGGDGPFKMFSNSDGFIEINGLTLCVAYFAEDFGMGEGSCIFLVDMVNEGDPIQGTFVLDYIKVTAVPDLQIPPVNMISPIDFSLATFDEGAQAFMVSGATIDFSDVEHNTARVKITYTLDGVEYTQQGKSSVDTDYCALSGLNYPDGFDLGDENVLVLMDGFGENPDMVAFRAPSTFFANGGTLVLDSVVLDKRISDKLSDEIDYQWSTNKFVGTITDQTLDFSDDFYEKEKFFAIINVDGTHHVIELTHNCSNNYAGVQFYSFGTVEHMFFDSGFSQNIGLSKIEITDIAYMVLVERDGVLITEVYGLAGTENVSLQLVFLDENPAFTLRNVTEESYTAIDILNGSHTDEKYPQITFNSLQMALRGHLLIGKPSDTYTVRIKTRQPAGKQLIALAVCDYGKVITDGNFSSVKKILPASNTAGSFATTDETFEGQFGLICLVPVVSGLTPGESVEIEFITVTAGATGTDPQADIDADTEIENVLENTMGVMELDKGLLSNAEITAFRQLEERMGTDFLGNFKRTFNVQAAARPITIPDNETSITTSMGSLFITNLKKIPPVSPILSGPWVAISGEFGRPLVYAVPKGMEDEIDPPMASITGVPAQAVAYGADDDYPPMYDLVNNSGIDIATGAMTRIDLGDNLVIDEIENGDTPYKELSLMVAKKIYIRPTIYGI
jgi:hypothetical protein